MTTTSATSSTTASTATTAATSASATSTNSSLGQTILSTLTTGSGIDTGTIITALTAAKKSSLEDNLTTQQTANTAQISSLATISSDISTFASSLQQLIAGGTLQTQPTSSNSSVLTATALSGATIGDLADTVNVSQLAQAQTLESTPVADDASYASGTLQITTTGGASVTLTAGTDFTDLNSLVTAINAQTGTTGVTASTVSNSSGTHLVMKGTTGSAQGFSIAATGDAAAFAYTPTSGDTSTADVTGASGSTGMQRLQVAQNSAFTIDGVSYSRSSNTVADAINGVSLVLAGTGTTTMGSTRPTAAITQAVNDYVTTYNQLIAALGTATAGATSTASAGPLRGNSTIRDMQRQLAALTTTPLTASGTINTLAQIGVSTNQDGTLSVNSTALSNALINTPDAVEAMFNSNQTSSAAGVAIGSQNGAVTSGVYALTNLVAGTSTTNASGNINGVAGTGNGTLLTAASGSSAAGLILTVVAGAPSSATITINQGLGGALQAISDALTGSSGTITTLSANLTSQNTTIATELATADTALTAYTTLITNQFSTMNTRVAAIKAQESYLTQQTALWDNPDAQ